MRSYFQKLALWGREQKRLWTERREAEIEAAIPKQGLEKRKRIELGLNLLSAIASKGRCYSHQEIANWCNCNSSAIKQIERRALKKLRIKCCERYGKNGLDYVSKD